MDCHSMTGFGQAASASLGWQVRVEIRTVNHRFAEFQIRLPREYIRLEEPIRKLLSEYIKRGRAEVYITLVTQGAGHRTVHIDWHVLNGLHQAGLMAAHRFERPLPDDVLFGWLVHPQVMQVESSDEFDEQIGSVVLSVTREACDKLVEMRRREGQRLADDLIAKTDVLSDEVQVMVGRASSVVDNYREKLRQRVENSLSSLDSLDSLEPLSTGTGRPREEFQGASLPIDESRLLTEVVLFAERSTIDEELVRLQSHLAEFRRAMRKGSPVGRRLDFIVQELHRELNTVASKSVDFELSNAAVNAKVVVEQMREQVQNIE